MERITVICCSLHALSKKTMIYFTELELTKRVKIVVEISFVTTIKKSLKERLLFDDVPLIVL